MTKLLLASLPVNVIGASKTRGWRPCATAGAGAAETWEARRARAAVMVKDCMVEVLEGNGIMRDGWICFGKIED